MRRPELRSQYPCSPRRRYLAGVSRPGTGRSRGWLRLAAGALGLLGMLGWGAPACSPDYSEQHVKTGSQTNWLRLCDSNADCGELECVCGVCSSGCTTDAQCSELSGASCVEASDPDRKSVV